MAYIWLPDWTPPPGGGGGISALGRRMGQLCASDGRRKRGDQRVAEGFGLRGSRQPAMGKHQNQHPFSQQISKGVSNQPFFQLAAFLNAGGRSPPPLRRGVGIVGRKGSVCGACRPFASVVLPIGISGASIICEKKWTGCPLQKNIRENIFLKSCTIESRQIFWHTNHLFHCICVSALLLKIWFIFLSKLFKKLKVVQGSGSKGLFAVRCKRPIFFFFGQSPRGRCSSGSWSPLLVVDQHPYSVFCFNEKNMKDVYEFFSDMNVRFGFECFV